MSWCVPAKNTDVVGPSGQRNQHDAEGADTPDQGFFTLLLDFLKLFPQNPNARRQRGEPYDDLVQVARLGLLKAMDRFDPEIGTPFGAYATVTMVGELRRHFRDTTWQVHVPRRIKDLQTSLRAAIESLTHELGRPPRPIELSERLGVSEDVVLEALDGANAYRTDSLDSSSNDRFAPGLDRLSSEQPSQESSIDLREVIAQLPDRERRIIELRYFEGWSQSEIADHVGISQVHVSRLLRATLGTLHASLTA